MTIIGESEEIGLLYARMAIFDPEGVLDLRVVPVTPSVWSKEGF